MGLRRWMPSRERTWPRDMLGEMFEERVTAELDNGVLKIELPKTAEKRKRIPVEVKRG